MNVTLRKIGGSLSATLPADVVKDMALKTGQEMEVERDGGRITLKLVKQATPKRYTLAQILRSCDLRLPKTEDEIAWENAPRVGRELL